MNIFSTTEKYALNMCFKTSSKINLNSKVLFVAITISLFYSSVSVQEKCFGKKALGKLSIAWVWAKSRGWGVGSFSVAEPGSSLKNYPAVLTN